MNFKYAEIVIVSIEIFKSSGVDLVLQLGDTKVSDFDWVGEGPFKTNWCWWKVVDLLEQVEVCSSVECLTDEIDDEWLSIHDLKEGLEVMLLDFFWIIEDIQLHLLTWKKSSTARVNIEDLVIKDVLLKSLLRSWLTWICPLLHLNL